MSKYPISPRRKGEYFTAYLHRLTDEMCAPAEAAQKRYPDLSWDPYTWKKGSKDKLVDDAIDRVREQDKQIMNLVEARLKEKLRRLNRLKAYKESKK